MLPEKDDAFCLPEQVILLSILKQIGVSFLKCIFTIEQFEAKACLVGFLMVFWGGGIVLCFFANSKWTVKAREGVTRGLPCYVCPLLTSIGRGENVFHETEDLK